MERFSLSSTKVGDTLLRIGNYASAKEQYLKVASAILGPTFQIPITADGGVLSPKYASLDDSKIADLMSCYTGIAQCERKAGKEEEENWTPWFPDNVNVSVQFAKARALAGKAFLALGNTGTAVHRRWTGHGLIPEFQEREEPEITHILSMDETRTLAQLRHPDPKLSHLGKVDSPSLQVMGSWMKLKVKKAGGPGRRMTFSSFIWEGHLYIAGGRRDSLGPFYRDIFSLDLNKLDGWRTLPEYPQPMSRTSAWLGWNLIPCPEHKKAYLFTGRPVVDFFDLTTKTWGSITTKFVRTEPADTQAGIKAWPYPGTQLTDSTQQIIREKLYVFGGTHANTNVGCNLFMVLDLKTKEWRRLSGTAMAPRDADVTVPGPRKTPNSWHEPAANKFCLIFGECDRMGASLKGELHGGECGHAFDDFWSWDIGARKWTRERMVGNVPCPRSEAACVYHPLLNKTIVWGGYNPDLPTDYVENGMTFSFSYYADTFIYDGSPRENEDSVRPRKWKQVLTKGFPTYRAQSHLLVDSQSGRTYLFGGFANNDYVPYRKTAITRAFGDLWELRIDLPGGHFEGVDVEDEARTAQLGPWQRCFTCGSAGPWRKCGGSCRGRAFFCDPECLKEGWKDHKSAHGCKKLE
ncbi:hypothetical protein GALMADRAFT_232259 [Galerina marginata CBS 339.88]|uniref:Uncharacterized protein n=1 Tax=Galerina marginata (strain CBS 339.88) TaxID=685588 RepID=A0A067S8A7_GALM3|nr:hypothetical protein GALMADRAFT_232259 [Galerina marginata CBS 339.88]